MSTATPSSGISSRRAMQAAAQVLMLVLGVPLGILSGWYALAPSPARLAEQAAGGTDPAALLELVQRAGCEEAAAAELLRLLEKRLEERGPWQGRLLEA